ncbi:MAG TPA: carboxypeptidase regulatory-like domain-containing protein [Longimicrobiales bacterium]|nr:carboxypeptidase regulatory-like domain-containing protein [Longimicrobiales bacterium]
MSPRLLVLALGVLLLPGRGASGQLVTGEVLEAETGAPVAGAFDRLMGAGGASRATFLTGPDGRYQVQAPTAGEYSLRVERIGYEAVTVGPLNVESPRVTRQTIRVNQQAIELEGLVVATAGRRCDLDEGSSGATQVVWDQVRTALDAASWTSRQRGLSFRIRHRQSRLSPGDGTVIDENRSTVTALGGNSVRSLPAEVPAAEGYVRTLEDGSFEDFGPDAEVVLSRPFLDAHCFGLRRGEGDTEGMIGLEFEPAGTPERSDVSGVAWLDEATSRLVFLEFHYEGLPYDVGTEHAGGEVHYEELPDGRWIVRDWVIRAFDVEAIELYDGPSSGPPEFVQASPPCGSIVIWTRR